MVFSGSPLDPAKATGEPREAIRWTPRGDPATPFAATFGGDFVGTIWATRFAVLPRHDPRHRSPPPDTETDGNDALSRPVHTIVYGDPAQGSGWKLPNEIWLKHGK